MADSPRMISGSRTYVRWGMGLVALCLLVLFTGTRHLADQIPVGAFSTLDADMELPEGWQPILLDGKDATRYDLVEDEGRVVVMAESKSAASAVGRAVRIDPLTYRFLRWDWKVANVLSRGDLTSKVRDDAPARIFVAFDYDASNLSWGEWLQYKAFRALGHKDIPLRALNYTWANHAPVGRLVTNPYTNWIKVIPVESGTENVGQWRSEVRDVAADYRRAFSEEPGKIKHVFVMTDTENTGSEAIAYYGDILFQRTIAE